MDCKRSLAVIGVFLLAVAGGCGDDGEGARDAHPLPPNAVGLGGPLRIVLQLEAGDMELQRAGKAVLRLPLDSWQLGLVDGVQEMYNYDPYPLYQPTGLYQPPPGLRWLSPKALAVEQVGANGWVLHLGYAEGVEASLEIRHESAGRFQVQWCPRSGLGNVAYFRLRVPVTSQEAFYGLGEHFDHVEQRGKLRPMQIELDPELESLYNEVHVPIPLLLSTAGWGLFVASDFPAVFDVARRDPQAVESVWGSGLGSELGLTVYWLLAEHPLDLTRHYYEITGRYRVPPSWVYGPLVWRDENRDQQQFESDLRTMRALDLPASGVWIDRPYATAVNTFDFDPGKFPDPARMFELAEELGYRVALWHAPYLDRAHPATRSLRGEALTQGYFPPRFGLLFNPWGEPLDFTNPGATAWWQSLLRVYTQLGVRGFKLDYAEDVVVGVAARRNRWAFFNGSDERTMHSRYQWFYHAAYAGVLPDEGGLLLVRHSVFGDQAHGVVVWPGDLDASFAEHRERVEEDGTSYVAVGGLPAALVAGLSLGPSGFPLYGSDTGGYRHAPPDKELFTRWFQQTALSTVMQIGTNTNDVAWEPTEKNGFDSEMLDWYREYTRLHLRLFPYVWSAVHRLVEDGRAVQRPLGLAYPELGLHPWDQYLLGDDLLVAPVVRRNQREREVIFPPGRWFDWWDQSVYEGPSRARVSAPLPRLPLFIRQGGIVPLLRPGIDTLAPAAPAAGVDSYAASPGPLYVRCALGNSGRTSLFDGTVLAHRILGASGTGFDVEVEYRPGANFAAGALFELLLADRPAQITGARGTNALPALATWEELERAEHGFTNDRGLWVKVSPADGRSTVRMRYVGSGAS